MGNSHQSLEGGAQKPYEDRTIVISILYKGKLRLREVK